MGMVFQQFNLFPNMTVLENITLSPVKTKGVSKAEAEAKAYDLLDKVGLRDKADAYPTSLSGGQQQRIAIARGLAMDQMSCSLTNQHQRLTQKWLVKCLVLCKIWRNLG